MAAIRRRGFVLDWLGDAPRCIKVSLGLVTIQVPDSALCLPGHVHGTGVKSDDGVAGSH